MNAPLHSRPRLTRLVKEFHLFILATFAALALTGCGAGEPEVHAQSSLARGVQDILQPSTSPNGQQRVSRN